MKCLLVPETIEIAVAGVMFEGRQDLLASLYREQEQGAAVAGMLEREPSNRHDRNAIKVLLATPTQGQHVGYVPRPLAAQLAPHLDAGGTARVTLAKIVCGGDPGRMAFGVRVLVDTRGGGGAPA